VRRRIGLLTLSLCVAAAGAFVAAVPTPSKPGQSAPTPPAPATLPRLGMQVTPLPEGAGKAVADAACLSCHASDIIRQQRLTKAQWTGTLTKMANWGSAIPEGQRDVLLEYLASNFGPENSSFQPVVVRPVGR
jgi:hypothetical protein